VLRPTHIRLGGGGVYVYFVSSIDQSRYLPEYERLRESGEGGDDYGYSHLGNFESTVDRVQATGFRVQKVPRERDLHREGSH
jgi:hypothetical protein